jgi:hypothetical protein
MFLNPGIKSMAKLIKNECRVGLAKRRSMIKTRELNLSISPDTGSKESNSNNPSVSKMETIYPFNPVKLHLPIKKSREWIKFASQKKETKPSIPAKLDILINKNVLANQVTCLTRLVSYDAKVKSFIPDKPSVLLNNSTLGDQVTYLKVNYLFIPVEYIATKKSNIMKEKSIFRIDRSTQVGAYSFQKRIQGTQLPVFPIPARTILW